MTYEQRAAFYRRSVDTMLADAFERLGRLRADPDLPDLPDDIVCLIAIRDCLREIADEAEARINIEAQTRSILGNAI